MQQDQRAVLAATGRLWKFIFAFAGAASLYGFVLLLPHLKWPPEEPVLAVWFVTLMLLATGVGFVRLLLGSPYRQSLSFDAQLGVLEVEYCYLGKTVRRILERVEVASLDWVVIFRGTESQVEGLRLILSDGPVLFLEARRDAATVFAQALGLQFTEVEWNAWPETPSVWNAERALYPASAAG